MPPLPAALAAASELLRDDSPAWAAQALEHAQQLYDFATLHPGSYADATDPTLRQHQELQPRWGGAELAGRAGRMQLLAKVSCLPRVLHECRFGPHRLPHCSQGFKDELAFAAAMLLHATGARCACCLLRLLSWLAIRLRSSPANPCLGCSSPACRRCQVS